VFIEELNHQPKQKRLSIKQKEWGKISTVVIISRNQSRKNIILQQVEHLEHIIIIIFSKTFKIDIF